MPADNPDRDGAVNNPSEVAQRVLARAQEGRFIIEDFKPLPDSIEWDLGQRYWRERGSAAFTADASPVPFVVNNDGVLSANAAEVFFSSLVEAEKHGPLERRLFVLELGIGVGLFARLFLDAFKAQCGRERKDYYQRLIYVAGDRSERMLVDACRNGIFLNHRGHYLLRVVDAFEPEQYLGGDGILPPRPPFFRAIFLNYLLDCLPCTHVKVVDGEVRQLNVRTCLARNVNLAEFSNLTPEDLAKQVQLPRSARPQSLLDLYDLFASEYAYEPVAPGQVPYRDFVLDFAARHSPSFLLNYGALQCLERLLDLSYPGGFILANDYGQVKLDSAGDFEHQRFSYSTAVGVHFPVLKAFFANAGKCQWFEPKEDSDRIYSRLLGRAVPPATVELFAHKFSKPAYEHLQEPWNLARANINHYRFEAAISAYHQALQRQPFNWLLMNEIANFLTFTVRNPRAGIDMAKSALALNPACFPELWNTLGDCYFAAGQYRDAQKAFLRALQISPRDVKARYNLAWIFIRNRDFRAALNVIAEGLGFDETGQYSERLLQKQSEVLRVLTQRNQMRQLLLANRISKRTSEAVPAPMTPDK